MANLTPKTISQLPSASLVNDVDLFVISQLGHSNSLSASTLASYMETELGVDTITSDVAALQTSVTALQNTIGSLSISTGNISANSSGSINIPNGKDCVVFFSSAGSGSKDIFVCHSQTNGVVTYARVLSASNLTPSTSSNTLTIASSASVTVYYLVLTF